MIKNHRLASRTFQYLIVFVIAGCGDAFVKELKTTDGRIRITIRDPSECDQSKYIYGVVTGLSENKGSERIGLRNVACQNQIDSNVFVLLEGTTWCAVANADVMVQNPNDPLGAVSMIIDRSVGRIHVDDGRGFSGCPKPIKESVSNAVKSKGKN